jgi:hypothetical protein
VAPILADLRAGFFAIGIIRSESIQIVKALAREPLSATRSRLKRSRLPRGCFDGPPAAPPLAAALMPVGGCASPEMMAGSNGARAISDPTANARLIPRLKLLLAQVGRAHPAVVEHP